MNLEAKYLFFDLDDTLTPNKTLMEDDMHALLHELPQTKVIVSGANVEQIIHQTRGLPFHKLGQNGNHAVDIDNKLLWEERLFKNEIDAIQAHINAIKQHVAHSIDVVDNALFNNGCQVTFSLVKQGTARTVKETFDPEKKLRREILAATPCEHDAISITIAGATSFDYLRKGKHKGYFVQKFIDLMQWDKNKCLYFGDSFYPGGNDEPVTGIIETVPVQNHHETFQHLLKFKRID